ncbi:MAG: alpha/beta hydrolase [Pirellulales bacterium]|jgi:acetyl esterase/lipase
MLHFLRCLVATMLCFTCTIPTLAEPQLAKNEFAIWPGSAPGETGDIGPEIAQKRAGENPSTLRITNVSRPTLTAFIPEKNPGKTAVVICPGGAYNILAFDKEGTEVAQWLNELGVAAFVLKYRVPRRDKEQPLRIPLRDSQRAMRLVRQDAEKWGIAPDRIGILGFSAGGHLAVMTGTLYNRPGYKKTDAADELSARPNFMIPIYAAYLGKKGDDKQLSDELLIDKNTPPTFLAVSQDDKNRGLHAALLFAELTRVGVKAEVHVYSQGGHGYGLRPSDQPVSSWHDRAEQWLKINGWLSSPVAK